MPQNRHTHLIGQVQPVSVALELIHHTQRLLVVMKGGSHHVGKRGFSRVTEGRVPQIMPIGGSLG